MAATETSFDQLLAKAPVEPSADTVTVFGAVARSPHRGKFVLMAPDGRKITLDVAAVKQHKVIAQSVGQLLVELELDKEQMPTEAETIASFQYPLHRVILKTHADHTSPQYDQSFALDQPFVTASPHQAAASTIAALYNLPFWFPFHHPVLKTHADHTSPQYDQIPQF